MPMLWKVYAWVNYNSVLVMLISDVDGAYGFEFSVFNEKGFVSGFITSSFLKFKLALCLFWKVCLNGRLHGSP